MTLSTNSFHQRREKYTANINLQKQPSIGVLIKRCSEKWIKYNKFTGDHPYRKAIS